jgi:hypothetical protein
MNTLGAKPSAPHAQCEQYQEYIILLIEREGECQGPTTLCIVLLQPFAGVTTFVVIFTNLCEVSQFT